MSSKALRTNQSEETNGRKPTEAEIAVAAYHLHIQNGSLHGHDLEDWLKAEQLLTQHMEETVPELVAQAALNPMSSFTPNEISPAHLSQKPARDDIRRQSTAFRPASRQTRPSKHAVRANS